MFRFKQPSSGGLPFVLCYCYNGHLKYVVKDHFNYSKAQMASPLMMAV